MLFLPKINSIFWSDWFNWSPCRWYFLVKSLLLILLSSGSLSNNWKSSKLSYIFKNYFYSTKPYPDGNFCLNDWRCGGNFDLVLFISCLFLGLCLLDCNLDFINVLGIYYVKNYISLIDNLNDIDCPLNDALFSFFFTFERNTWNDILWFHHIPLYTTLESTNVFISWRNRHREFFYYSTSFTFKKTFLWQYQFQWIYYWMILYRQD